VTKKAKPKLHLVRGDKDIELYSPELDWYYGCLDSICGLATIGAAFEKESDHLFVGGPCYRESNWYTDAHVTFKCSGFYPGAFTKARRIWRALQVVSYRERELLRRLYEPRQWFPPEYKHPTEAEIRSAHKSYSAAREITREAA
jgi:hypothetical protein